MTLRSTKERWGWVTRVLHWTIALAVLGMLAAGLYAVNFVDTSTADGDKQFYAVIDIHKSFGLSILLLMVVRVLWRLSDRTPAFPVAMPTWERFAARTSEFLLYLGLFVMPISGYLWASAYGEPVRFFGIKLPALVQLTGPWIRLAKHTHDIAAFVLLTIVVLHVLGALKNHFVDRNDVLRKMLGVQLQHADREAAPLERLRPSPDRARGEKALS